MRRGIQDAIGTALRAGAEEPTMTRILVTTSALVGAIGVILPMPDPAAAGTVSAMDPAGDVEAKGLSAKERAAVDIKSVTVSGEGSLGMLATVELAGNFTKAIGRGELENAQAELLLQPSSTDADAARLASEGAGIIGRTVRDTASKKVGALRDGHTLTFFIFGAGFSKVASAEVSTFSRGSRAAAARRQPLVFDEVPSIPTNPAPLSCDALKAERDRVKGMIERKKEYRKLNQKVLDETDELIRKKESTIKRKLAKLYEALGLPTGPGQEIEELKEKRKAIKKFIDEIDNDIDYLKGLLKGIEDRIAECEGLGARFLWETFGTNEVRGVGSFFVQGGGSRSLAGARGASGPLDAVKVVVPPEGATERRITNQLCPIQLPNPEVSKTTNPDDTLTCTGGTLQVGEQFSLNVRTTPPPTAGMGGQLFGRQGGSFKGPFTITGP